MLTFKELIWLVNLNAAQAASQAAQRRSDMLYYDIAFLLIPLVVCTIVRSPNSLCVAIPTAFTFFYAYQSTLFDSHSGVINHVIYGLAFISTAYFASKRLAFALCVYSTFQFFYALDYFIRPNDAITLFSSVYFVVHNLLNFLLILAMFDRGYNDSKGCYRNAVFNPVRVVNLWHNQSHTKESAKP